MTAAKSSASGRAACPGPPASATTAVRDGFAAAARRTAVSWIAPGTTPVRSSGTSSVPHSKPAGWVQGT